MLDLPSWPDFPPLPLVPAPTYICQLTPGCMLPLEATFSSIREHLRIHGYFYRDRQRARYPWAGCSQEMWTNVPRHIRESHLDVKICCEKCGKEYKRNEALAAHTTKCASLWQHLCITMTITDFSRMMQLGDIGVSALAPWWLRFNCLSACIVLLEISIAPYYCDIETEMELWEFIGRIQESYQKSQGLHRKATGVLECARSISRATYIHWPFRSHDNEQSASVWKRGKVFGYRAE